MSVDLSMRSISFLKDIEVSFRMRITSSSALSRKHSFGNKIRWEVRRLILDLKEHASNSVLRVMQFELEDELGIDDKTGMI